MSEARKETVRILKECGVRAYSRGSSNTQFKAEGIKGNSFIAFIMSYIPLISELGYFSRIMVRAKGLQSLKEGEDDFHLFIQVYPIRELTDDRESAMLTQSLGEHIGDHFQSKRYFAKVVGALRTAGLI